MWNVLKKDAEEHDIILWPYFMTIPASIEISYAQGLV